MLDIVVESFRGIAAIWVFLFHLDRPTGSAFLAALAGLGHLGVPMFFVISGFCIGGSAQASVRRGEPAGAFLRRRLRRIYPPLWASMLIVIALPFLLEAISALHTGAFQEPTPEFLSYSAFDWLGIATLGQVFVARGRDLEAAFSGFNAVYWTLAIEVQFYLVMFAALLLGRWRDRFLLGVTVAGFALACIPFAYRTGVFLPYWPLFAVGLALQRAIEAGHRPRNAILAHGGAIALLAAFAFLVQTGAATRLDNARPYATFFLFGLGFAALLWCATRIEPALFRLRAGGPAFARALLRLLLALGAASYSIYLLHGKLFALPAMFARRFFSPGSLAHLAITMAVTLALAWLFSLAVEQRFIRGGRGKGAVLPSNAAMPQAAPGD